MGFRSRLTDGRGSGGGGAGDVTGPASSTDNALARFDGTTGKIIQNSSGILTDAGALSGVTAPTSIITSGQFVAERIATGTATSGYIPVAAGVGSAPAWTAQSGGAALSLLRHHVGTTFGTYGTQTYYANLVPNNSVSLSVMTADRDYFCPFFAPNLSCTLVAMMVNVTSAVGGSTGRFAIYSPASSTDLWPTTLVQDLGTFSTATTTVTESTLSPSLSISPGDFYWLVVNFSGAPQILRQQHDASGPIMNMAIQSSPSGVGTPFSSFYIGRAHAAYPSTYSKTTPNSLAGQVTPVIFLRFT